jgi:CDP-glucose 4,6-dehydratase
LFHAAGVAETLASHHEADLRDHERLFRVWRDSGATVLFHLAAQPLVRESYRQPYETFAVNALGSAAALEALRRAGRPAAAVLVTTDKCYENFEEVWGRRETDPLGGHDPYSASKAAAELAAASWRRAFFSPESGVRLATARAGNVIGGGDWAAERLVPDLARACRAGRSAPVRNPGSVRPWQHVLESLSGYLLLAERLLTEPENPEWPSTWNFGPKPGEFWTVRRLAESFCAAWGAGASWSDVSDPAAPFESAFLSLCIDKASRRLGWRPRWNTAEAVARTAVWYRAWADDASPARLGRIIREQIEEYMQAENWESPHA